MSSSVTDAGIEDARTREKAEALARDIIECLDSIDYNKYFDAMGRPGSRGGSQEKQFSDFSIRAVDASQVRLDKCKENSCCVLICMTFGFLLKGLLLLSGEAERVSGAHASGCCGCSQRAGYSANVTSSVQRNVLFCSCALGMELRNLVNAQCSLPYTETERVTCQLCIHDIL